eukprot:6207674-Pleurochrysis_carterae.AAC.1
MQELHLGMFVMPKMNIELAVEAQQLRTVKAACSYIPEFYSYTIRPLLREEVLIMLRPRPEKLRPLPNLLSAFKLCCRCGCPKSAIGRRQRHGYWVGAYDAQVRLSESSS